MSGEAPRHDTWICWHATGSATVTIAAVGTATDGTATDGTATAGAAMGVLGRGAVTPEGLVLRVEMQTLLPTKRGVVNVAPFILRRRACGTLNRAARRVHESLFNTR